MSDKLFEYGKWLYLCCVSGLALGTLLRIADLLTEILKVLKK